MSSSFLLRAVPAGALVLFLSACGGTAGAPAAPAPGPAPGVGADAPAAPSPGSASSTAEEALVALLDTELLTPEREARILELDSMRNPLPRRLGRVARDEDAPTFARGNALLLLGQLGAYRELGAFAAGLRAEDPNVRAAAATGLEGVLDSGRADALTLVRRALQDEEPWVQARALQSLGARDPALLRAYIPLAPTEELRAIARSLLQLAVERGAPLSEGMATGAEVPETLSRETSGGHRVLFQARERWPQWGAAWGRLSVARPAGDTVTLADDVEVVAGVVPAFFSPDERWLVYEAGRQVRVRDLQTGAERVVGDGLAPRPLPFSERFVFVRPLATDSEDAGEARLRYAVLAASFAGGDPEPLGELSARTSMLTFGNYAPVRWMRVHQSGEEFFLDGAGLERFDLPDPFSPAM